MNSVMPGLLLSSHCLRPLDRQLLEYASHCVVILYLVSPPLDCELLEVRECVLSILCCLEQYLIPRGFSIRLYVNA